jgi:hypothetical protein
MNTNNQRPKLSLVLVACMLFAGCAGNTEAADDSELAGFVEEAQTFGVGGISDSPRQRVDPGDDVETYGPETVACGDVKATQDDLAAECEDEDGGVRISNLKRYNPVTEDCAAAIRCLFNVGAE